MSPQEVIIRKVTAYTAELKDIATLTHLRHFSSKLKLLFYTILVYIMFISV